MVIKIICTGEHINAPAPPRRDRGDLGPSSSSASPLERERGGNKQSKHPARPSGETRRKASSVELTAIFVKLGVLSIDPIHCETLLFFYYSIHSILDLRSSILQPFCVYHDQRDHPATPREIPPRPQPAFPACLPAAETIKA
jgi:hypothetical protein